MKAQEIIARLKAEVNRQAKSIDTATGDFAEGRRMEQRIILSVLSDLEKEEKPTPAEGLEEEINGQWGSYTHDGSSAGISREEFMDIARHFASWQKEQMMREAVSYVVQPDISVCGVGTDVPFLRIGSLALNSVGAKVGDSVKLIIIKED